MSLPGAALHRLEDCEPVQVHSGIGCPCCRRWRCLLFACGTVPGQLILVVVDVSVVVVKIRGGSGGNFSIIITLCA